MAVIIQQPDAVSFSSTMKDVVFSSTCDHAVVTVVLQYAGLAFIGLGVYEILPGFIAGLIAAVVVTLVDKEPSAEVQALFDRAASDTAE